jgi:hypothetical protein
LTDTIGDEVVTLGTYWVGATLSDRESVDSSGSSTMVSSLVVGVVASV